MNFLASGSWAEDNKMFFSNCFLILQLYFNSTHEQSFSKKLNVKHIAASVWLTEFLKHHAACMKCYYFTSRLKHCFPNNFVQKNCLRKSCKTNLTETNMLQATWGIITVLFWNQNSKTWGGQCCFNFKSWDCIVMEVFNNIFITDSYLNAEKKKEV